MKFYLPLWKYDLLDRLRLQYRDYLEADGTLDANRAEQLVAALERQKHLLGEIADAEIRHFYLARYEQFIELIEYEEGRTR